MEHPFTWHNLLPESWQQILPQHTFFALVAGLMLILFAWRARGMLARSANPEIPAEELGARNIAELLVQLVVSQSDAIIGPVGRKYVPFFGSFLFSLATCQGSCPVLLRPPVI